MLSVAVPPESVPLAITALASLASCRVTVSPSGTPLLTAAVKVKGSLASDGFGPWGVSVVVVAGDVTVTLLNVAVQRAELLWAVTARPKSAVVAIVGMLTDPWLLQL